MQAPPPSVPFVEYVLKAIEHPPFMFVSKLAACCTILFLTRSDPELLRTLCFKWAIRFQKDRKKLIGIIRRRSQVCKAADTAEEKHKRSICSSEADSEECGQSRERLNRDSTCDTDDEEEGDDDDDEEGADGLPLCNPDDAVEHFLKMLNSLVFMYFSWNWRRTDYVIQINKEYEAYVRENILPICIATPAEDGLDDDEETPWLLSPSAYLSDASPSIGNFYSPVTRKEPTLVAATPMTAEGHYTNGQQTGKRTGVAASGSTASARAVGPLDVNAPSGHVPTTNTALAGSRRFVPEGHPSSTGALDAGTSFTAVSKASGPLFTPTRPDASTGNVFLSFVTLENFREVFKANQTGLVIIFHAKYSAKSNEVLEIFQEIARKRPLDPMPDIAVVYTVAEPELASLYNVSWFPTVIYIPPPQHQRQERDGEEKEKHGTRAPHMVYREASTAIPTRPDTAPGKPSSVLSTPVREDGEPARKPTAPTTSSLASTEEMGNSTTSGRLGTTGDLTVSASSPRSTTMARRSIAGSLGAATCAVSMPVVPSPMEVLYGRRMRKESPGGPLVSAKMSPSTGNALRSQPQQQQIQSPVALGGALTAVTSQPVSLSNNHNTNDSTASNAGANESSTLCGEQDGRLHSHTQSPNTNQMLTSPSTSSFSVFADHSADVATEELEECIAQDGHKVFPINGVISVASLVGWISSKGQVPPKIKKIKDFVTRVSTLRAEQKYQKFRELHSAVVMLRRLQNSGAKNCIAVDSKGKKGGDATSPGANSESSPVRKVGGRVNHRPLSLSPGSSDDPTADPCGPNEPPLFIFLGGGMAAGKSTAAMALAHSSWWRNHKDQSVLVNADEFKVTEPIFEGVQAEVHTKSTRAAESLLVQAINQGRSIVFDGTMMWSPFVLQVIDMVRNARLHLYKQGPGYSGPNNPEQYFLPSGVRPTPLPNSYVIRFLGITVEPEIAVPRGFLRKFSTGRGVPITTQLRSFKMFAENYPLYASLVDAATLYNNNVFVDLDKGELPPVMAEQDMEKTGGKLVIYDDAAYQLFMKQKTLFEDADNILELYPVSSPTSSIMPVEANGTTD